ncbi:MAG TPA: hypothetical protein VFH47_00480, partial [Candidatus Thermoplasmatota archaeon]|nr:hypothetical protein [Candidatus Thermoplasmatota archaeon]
MRPPALATLLLLAAATVLVGGTGAAACEPRHVEHLGMACRQPDGMWEVVLPDGLRLTTHGPDPYLDPALDAFAAFEELRDPVCVTQQQHVMHVLYGHTGNDRTAAVVPEIRDHVRRMNALLALEARESGGVLADYRVLCGADGSIVVDAFRGPSTGGAYTSEYDAIVSAACAAGFTQPAVDYLIFYDASSSVCGVANLARDSRLSANNRNVVETGYGIVYEGCWTGRTPMHENAHNQGAVQDLAPDWDLTGHCLEGRDVMCYPTSSILVLCGDRIRFDCDNDTYFDAAPEPGEWLATNWNIGSRVNPFLAFRDIEP